MSNQAQSLSVEETNKLLHEALTSESRDDFIRVLGMAPEGYVKQEGHHLIHWCWNADEGWAWPMAKALIRQGADINQPGGQWREYLLWRFIEKYSDDMGSVDLACLDEILELGALVDVRDDLERTPLTYAASRTNSIPVLERLIRAGADVNAADEMCDTALCVASGAEVARVLVASGANVHYTYCTGYTLLMQAVDRGVVDLVAYFLSIGLDPNQVDESNETALHHAIRASEMKVAIVDALLLAGVNVDTRNREGVDAIAMARRNEQHAIADRIQAWCQAQAAAHVLEQGGAGNGVSPL